MGVDVTCGGLSVNIDELFPALAKYRVLSVSISGDNLSNMVYIERIYRVPWYESGIIASYNIHQYDHKEFKLDGATAYSVAGGWADPSCRSMRQIIQVIPNGGRIVYNDSRI